MALSDEVFFAMLTKKPSLGYSDTIVADAKRYVSFEPGDRHPRTLRNGDEHLLIAKDTHYFFARKVDPVADTQLAKWMDDKRASTDAEMGIAKSEYVFERVPAKA